MLGWSLVPLSWSKRCHWHLGNITNTHWIKQLTFALESFVPSFPDTRNTRLHYNLWIPLCWQFCHWYDRKHWKKYTHMYRILNRVSERPQTDSDKQHMWLVNKRFTVFFSFSWSPTQLMSKIGHAIGFVGTSWSFWIMPLLEFIP